jgi:opacity protein-like surface antigen
MKRTVMALALTLAFSGAAHAQTTTAPTTGYAQVLAQSAFGNVTSQSFGLEAGYALDPRLSVLLEIGRTRDTAPERIGPSAQQIAQALAQSQGAAVDYSVKQPVFFFGVGARYSFPRDSPFEPYVLGGVGIARVKKDVSFEIDGTDVTDSLDDYGVVLGSDLAGTATKPMISLGGGVVYRWREPWIFDLNYRFGRIFTDIEGTTVNRLGLGVGFTF